MPQKKLKTIFDFLANNQATGRFVFPDRSV